MKRKRLFAAFVSFLLIVCTIVSPINAKEYSGSLNSFWDKYTQSWSDKKSQNNQKKATVNATTEEGISTDGTYVDETVPNDNTPTDEVIVDEESSTDATIDDDTISDEAIVENEISGDEPIDRNETSAAEAIINNEKTPVYFNGKLTGNDGQYNVTVKLGKDAKIPEGAVLSVKELTDEDAAYQEAKEQVQAAEEEGFAALDISILDNEGNEIEPKAAVEVEIQLSQLPENVNAETEITVNHIDKSTGTAVVQAVADTAEETEGTVEVIEDAAVVNFTVDSFSTFTITYGAVEEAATDDGVEAYVYGDLTAYLVDTNGTQISTTTINTSGYSDWRNISNAVPQTPSGYTYVNARANSVNGEIISRIQYDNWDGWKYRNRNSHWGSDLAAIYFVYQSTGPVQVTLTFNTNGGSGSVDSITGTSGTSVTLPDYEGTRNGYTFLGWADSSAEFPGGTEYRAVYKAGTSYTLPTSNKTLYAAWQKTEADSTDAYFYIRLDGQIPYEPGTYQSADYTIGINMEDAVTLQQWVVDVDTTKDIVGNCVHNNVTAVLTKLPSDELIQRVCNEAGISYNPDTQYILWYVQKYQGLGANAIDESNGDIFGTDGEGWHIDGVLLDRAKVAISYDANVPTGVTEIPDIPQGYEVDRGTVVTVGQTGGVGGSMDRANPSITGYVFQGWNTRSDGTGTTYANEDTIPLYENMTLYAMWSKGGNTLSLSKVDGQGNTISGASFTISDGSNTESFNAGTYRNENIQTDTVYTITETAAPENYEGLDASFSFIVSSQGGTGLTAYFCDAEGNQVEAPDGVSLTYTNGLTNIRVTNIGYFYVYHSSNQSVDTYPVSGSFDITALVADGYLYGGYYSDYKKAGSYEGGPNATYDGTSYAGAIAGYWDSSAAYTANGTTMIPVAGQTYYLKEVPEDYFKPYMAVVYDSYVDPNSAEGLYLISATDDKNYQDFGLEAVNAYTQEKAFAMSFIFQQEINTSAKTVITAKSAFGVPAGYLGVWNANEELTENNTFYYRPYVVTPDGVKVYGTTTRTVYTGDVTYRETLDKGPGVYKVDSQ